MKLRRLLPVLVVAAAAAQSAAPSFTLPTRRMDVDVDGAPKAYGPKNLPTLDTLRDAHYRRRMWASVVGYITEHGHPVIQSEHDPAPGYYVSQTAYEDESRAEHDPRRYLDATAINYVVRGDEAKKRGVQLGDFVAVHSRRTGKSVFAIVGDDGNPSGDEGSLHLLNDLGYPFRDGRDESVEDADILIRFYPHSNPRHFFPHTQAELDRAAITAGLVRDFPPTAASKH